MISAFILINVGIILLLLHFVLELRKDMARAKAENEEIRRTFTYWCTSQDKQLKDLER